MDIIKSIEHEQLKNKIPELKVGNTVKVHVRIKEGNKERIQVFEGIIIKVQGGGVNKTFTVRKISYGVGVEKTFLVHSPLVEKVEDLAKQNHLIILCGHYEGIDQRVLDKIVDEEVSIGDYVLTGGEIPAMVLIDSVSRYVEGVLNKESIKEESFSNGLLEYPQYTRPEVFEGEKVPDILLSGNHQNIDKWRKQKSLEITKSKRPDLLLK